MRGWPVLTSRFPMKAVGEAAQGLPWLAPCASSLVYLAREGRAAWPGLRTDPGAVLLLARAAGTNSTLSQPFDSHFEQPTPLRLAQELLGHSAGWIDWANPAVSHLYKVCLQQAALAHGLAHSLAGCDPEKAWTAALLSPLGWMGAAAVAPNRLTDAIRGQGRFLNVDHFDGLGLGRRLARSWRLPAWLTGIISYLAMPVGTAQRLGVDPRLLQIVQLSAALVQSEENLPLGPMHADISALYAGLGLSLEFVEHQHELARQAAANLSQRTWTSPADQPLLKDLLAVALRNRTRKDQEFIDQLQREIELLHLTLEDQGRQEKERLQTLKLSSLAELAAGAGHEINNPLAVISGQAQYALRQVQQAEDELIEDTHALAVLGGLRGKVEQSLQTIVGQVQRVHQVLTNLMQFARPAAPRRQAVRLRELFKEVIQATQAHADNRKVRLVLAEPPENWLVHVDSGQVRTALLGLLRNAIDAAPAEGWAGLRAEARDGAIGVLIEDNGPGPTPLAQEHMFDPFFSGRTAGRGRGFGLPTAWRLARQQGGDVWFEGIFNGTTRFVLTLPDFSPSEPSPSSNGIQGGHGPEVLPKPHAPEPALNGVNGSH